GLGSAVRTREGLGVAVGLELVLQAPEADPQQPRRLRPVPSHPVQRLQNVLLLQLTQRQPRRQPRLGGLDAALSRSVAQREDVDVDPLLLPHAPPLPHTAPPLPPLAPRHRPSPSPPPARTRTTPPRWAPPPPSSRPTAPPSTPPPPRRARSGGPSIITTAIR